MDEQGTREVDKGVNVSRVGSDHGGSTVSGMGGNSTSSAAPGPGIMEQAGSMARNLGEQASAATGALYNQGARAGDYVSRNVNEYPLPALLVAGAIGYGLAYLIHTQWQNWDWRDWQLGGDWWGNDQRGRNDRYGQHDPRDHDHGDHDRRDHDRRG
jgi:hypothetical protein